MIPPEISSVRQLHQLALTDAPRQNFAVQENPDKPRLRLIAGGGDALDDECSRLLLSDEPGDLRKGILLLGRLLRRAELKLVGHLAAAGPDPGADK